MHNSEDYASKEEEKNEAGEADQVHRRPQQRKRLNRHKSCLIAWKQYRTSIDESRRVLAFVRKKKKVSYWALGASSVRITKESASQGV